MMRIWIHGLRVGNDMHEEKWDYGMHKKATVHRAMELGYSSGVYLIFTSEIPCLLLFASFELCCTTPLLKKATGKEQR